MEDLLILRLCCASLIVICILLFALWRTAKERYEESHAVAASMAKSIHQMLAEHENGLIKIGTIEKVKDAFSGYIDHVKSYE